jgi:hypothetical protein
MLLMFNLHEPFIQKVFNNTPYKYKTKKIQKGGGRLINILKRALGKTIGSNSYLALWIGNNSFETFTLDVWGVQVEKGTIATPFEQRPIGTELALCQRYYQRITPDISISSYPGFNDTTTTGVFMIPFTQTMRVKPTSLETSGTATDYAIRHKGSSITTCNTLPSLSSATTNYINFVATVASGLTAGESSLFRFGNANVAYLGWNAEL